MSFCGQCAFTKQATHIIDYFWEMRLKWCNTKWTRQWRSQVFENGGGVHEKTDFHKRRRREFGGESWSPLPFSRKKWIWYLHRCTFPLFWGLTYTFQSLFSRSSIARSQFLHPALHPRYFYANLDECRDPYFQKLGRYVPPYPDPRGSASGTEATPAWLRGCVCVGGGVLGSFANLSSQIW